MIKLKLNVSIFTLMFNNVHCIFREKGRGMKVVKVISIRCRSHGNHDFSRTGVLKYKCASESPGRLVKP